MANIIDYTYFVGDINLPQGGSSDGQAYIDRFITIYETEFLQMVLGYDLWKAFTDGLAAGSPDQKWIDLRDGKQFADLSLQNKKWIGFKNTNLVSPIANYVYCKIMEDMQTHTTSIGEAQNAAENAVIVSASHKIVNAWNRMVEMNLVLKDFLDANLTTYTDWGTSSIYYRNNFFQWIIKPVFRKVNVFGI